MKQHSRLGLLLWCSTLVQCTNGGAEVEVSLEEQGCSLSRTASAYRATASGSVAAQSAEAANVVPCLSLTGYGSNEPALGVASDGTVYFAPAFSSEGNGVARSENGGATWTLSIPDFDGGGHPRLQPFFYLDPATDRLFFSSSKLVLAGLASFVDDPGIHLSVSGDDGATWEHQVVAPNSRDWQKIFAGPPVSSTPTDYPNVVYLMAPSPIAGNWAGIYPPPDYQYFYKSLDGGRTWAEVSRIPVAPETIEGCTAGDYVMFGQGTVGTDGTIYLGYRRCQQLGVLVSHDEGATWETRMIPGAALHPYDTSSLLGILGIIGGENAITGEPIAVDSAGNLYAVWADPQDRLFFASSSDEGLTWTAPVSVMAPGVQSVRMTAITARDAGEAAISYFGTTDGRAFHGYIAQTTDGLATEPTFLTATVNEPSDPLYPDQWQSGYDLTYFDNGGDEITLIQVKYGPTGDVWASFVRDMCPRARINACSWDYTANTKSRFQGALGRLAHIAP